MFPSLTDRTVVTGWEFSRIPVEAGRTKNFVGFIFPWVLHTQASCCLRLPGPFTSACHLGKVYLLEWVSLCYPIALWGWVFGSLNLTSTIWPFTTTTQAMLEETSGFLRIIVKSWEVRNGGVSQTGMTRYLLMSSPTWLRTGIFSYWITTCVRSLWVTLSVFVSLCLAPLYVDVWSFVTCDCVSVCVSSPLLMQRWRQQDMKKHGETRRGFTRHLQNGEDWSMYLWSAHIQDRNEERMVSVNFGQLAHKFGFTSRDKQAHNFCSLHKCVSQEAAMKGFMSHPD